ncbi:MAG: Shedu immune nuclease family protein [Candidatus Paceibacterota bacterium]
MINPQDKSNNPVLKEFIEKQGSGFSNEPASSEATIVDNHRLDHLYTNAFRDGSGKYFTVVSVDDAGVPNVVDAESPYPTRNKIKTRLTFIKSEDGGSIKEIELKRFKFYKKDGYLEQEEGINFSFSYFVGLIGFLQSLSKLNLNDVTERRIPLHNGPDLDEETRKQFYTIVSTNDGQELIREVVKSGQISGIDIVNIAYRKKQLELFERMLSDPDTVVSYRKDNNIKKLGNEAVWQHFFEVNTWIFGYGLNYVFNQPLEGQKLERTVRGSDITGSGKRADGLLKTTGVVSSICLVEIKTPDTPLLELEEYRPECWQASREFSGGIAQAQKTVQKTLENIGTEFRPTDKKGNPTGEVLYSYRPKSFLVIGSLSEFSSPEGINREKFGSFELLRRGTHEPEVITFDELLERAKFIVINS